jgi:hypothetical protein
MEHRRGVDDRSRVKSLVEQLDQQKSFLDPLKHRSAQEVKLGQGPLQNAADSSEQYLAHFQVRLHVIWTVEKTDMRGEATA